MSLRIDIAELFDNSLVIGETGLGVMCENVPFEGTNGPSFLYNDFTLPEDAKKEIRPIILTWPSAGTLFVYENGSFEFYGAPDGEYQFTYQLEVDGTPTGSPATVTIIVGTSMWANGEVVTTMTSSISTSIRLGSGSVVVSTASGNLNTAIQMMTQAVVAATSTSNLSVTAGSESMQSYAQVNVSSTSDITTDILLNMFAAASAKGTARLTTTTAGGISNISTLTIKFMPPKYKVVFN